MKAPASASVPAPVAATSIAQFFIPAAASLQERRPRTLKHGDSFAVFDHNGDALAGPGSPEGLYHCDTRHLSHLYLTIDGQRPILLSSTLRDDNATLTCDLTNPDLRDADGQLLLEHDLIHVRRSRHLWDGACYERLALRNYDDAPRRLRVGIAFAADFADLFEVRGARRVRRGSAEPPTIEHDRVTLAYTGLDGRRRTTQLRFDPAPDVLSADQAVFELELAPRTSKTLVLDIRCNADRHPEPPRRAFALALRAARRALRHSSSRAAAVISSNEIFNEAVRRSVSDLYMLITDTAQGPYPYAGIPWFSTVFGRDALITALEMLWVDPAVARGVLFFLAEHQATVEDPDADAEPGKILHELRRGEMAELGEVPFKRYYGSVDSTPLFVVVAGAYLQRSGDTGSIARLWPAIEAALAWIDRYGDRDGDGFFEYDRRAQDGLANQGWKDSHDSVSHADGALARGAIALVEVQAYVYGAWRAAAEIARQLGHASRAGELERRAETLRRRFDQSFFDEALGAYVLALDGNKRPCRVRSSNAGHALLTGIAYPERAAAVAATLMDSPSFSGWGVRTLAAGEARYNPMSYHNGSVWPHDNALCAAGLMRYGFVEEAQRVVLGQLDVARTHDGRLPELFAGFDRRVLSVPASYPTSCSPQAWAAAAPLLWVRTLLRLDPWATKDRVWIDPQLPGSMRRLSVSGIRIGARALTVEVDGDHVDVGGAEGLDVVRRARPPLTGLLEDMDT